MRALAIIGLIVLAGCTTVRLENGCVVDALSHQYAVASQQQLDGKTAFNEVLAVKFVDAKTGHALSIFAHKGDLWAYDYERGSWKISEGTTHQLEADATRVAGLVYPRWRIKGARWL
jgi:hypothetical protein